MINIKVYAKEKHSSGGNTTSTTSSSASTSSSGVNVSDWFYYDPDTQSIVCKYQFMSVGDIIAFKNQNQNEGE